uniref:Putative pogo transposable element n=1 Tax=Hyalomma excavatum TaxID=257692 RepID=A0A131XQ93_9ACAR
MPGPRKQYSAAFKRDVITAAEKIGNSAAGRQFGVTEGSVRGWRRQKEALFACSGKRKSFRGPKNGAFPEIELALTEFVREQRAAHLPVSMELMQVKARELAREKGMSSSDFKASKHWIYRYMCRAGFSLRRRTSISQKLPEAFEELLVSFQRHVNSLRRSRNFQLGQIGNADQTPVYLDMPSPLTVHEKGSKQVCVRTTGNEKTRVTVMLSCTADGHKHPPYVVFKRKTMPKGEELPKNVIVRCQDKGWMNEDLVLDWIKSVWCRRPGALLSFPSILVLDAFRCHLADSVKKLLRDCGTELVVIPGGMTSQLQPLDVCVNKPFKDAVRRCYAEWMRSGEPAVTPTGRLKRASPATICKWIVDAWASIPEDLVRRSFKKCGISNALDGTEDEYLWDDLSDKEMSEESAVEDDSD